MGVWGSDLGSQNQYEQGNELMNGRMNVYGMKKEMGEGLDFVSPILARNVYIYLQKQKRTEGTHRLSSPCSRRAGRVPRCQAREEVLGWKPGGASEPG